MDMCIVRKNALDRGKNISGSLIRPGPYSPQAISPCSGPTNSTPSFCKSAILRCVAGCSHIRRFIAARRGFFVGGEQEGRSEIARQAMRHFGEKIGCGRRDNEEIRVAGEFDMAHAGIIGRREKIVVHSIAGQAFNRELVTNRCAASVMTRGRRCPARAGGGSVRAPYKPRCPADDQEKATFHTRGHDARTLRILKVVLRFAPRRRTLLLKR